MTGKVKEGQATLEVVLQLAGKPNLALEFVVDTGFEGELALSQKAVELLGLSRIRTKRLALENGDEVEIGVHSVTILWDEYARDVEVEARGVRPLLGTGLLAGHHFGVVFVEGGDVVVLKRPAQQATRVAKA